MLLSSFSIPEDNGASPWDPTTAQGPCGDRQLPHGSPVEASFGSYPTSSAQTSQSQHSSAHNPPSDGRDEVTLSSSESNHINIELWRLFPESLIHGTPCCEEQAVVRAKDTGIKT